MLLRVDVSKMPLNKRWCDTQAAPQLCVSMTAEVSSVPLVERVCRVLLVSETEAVKGERPATEASQ